MGYCCNWLRIAGLTPRCCGSICRNWSGDSVVMPPLLLAKVRMPCRKRRGNVFQLAGGGAVQALFVIEEKEHAVLLNRTADGEPELIAVQRLARDTGPVIEPVVGGENRVAIEFVQRAMKAIGSALGHQRDLSARAAALVGALAAHRDAKFLHRIERHRKRRVESGSAVQTLPFKPGNASFELRPSTPKPAFWLSLASTPSSVMLF